MAGTLTPSFSIVIPTHNRVQLLRRAIESVLAQEACAWEVIVVDDASTDETAELMKALCRDPRIRYVRKHKVGATIARNHGAEMAVNDFFIFLDSDDELLPGALAAFADQINDDSVGVICSRSLIVNRQGDTISESKPRNLGPAYENQTGLFLAGTFAIRRNVFEAVGRFSAECRSSQHTEFALRLMPYCLAHNWQVIAVDKSTVRIHQHAGQHLRGSIQNLLEGASYIIREHATQLKKSPQHYADWCTIAAVYAAKTRQYGLARRWFSQALYYGQRRPKNFARWLLTFLPTLAKRVWKPGA